MINFYSKYEDKMIQGILLEKRKHTVKIQLDNGRMIVKKYKQLNKGF